jgi:sugar/nucleoside kinase (ribokinase family)
MSTTETTVLRAIEAAQKAVDAAPEPKPWPPWVWDAWDRERTLGPSWKPAAWFTDGRNASRQRAYLRAVRALETAGLVVVTGNEQGAGRIQHVRLTAAGKVALAEGLQ